MAKIKLIKDIDIRTPQGRTYIEIGSYIDVTEPNAVYFCNEDIEALSLEAQKQHRRIKHAVRTPTEEQVNPHQDYTGL